MDLFYRVCALQVLYSQLSMGLYFGLCLHTHKKVTDYEGYQNVSVTKASKSEDAHEGKNTFGIFGGHLQINIQVCIHASYICQWYTSISDMNIYRSASLWKCVCYSPLSRMRRIFKSQSAITCKLYKAALCKTEYETCTLHKRTVFSYKQLVHYCIYIKQSLSLCPTYRVL